MKTLFTITLLLIVGLNHGSAQQSEPAKPTPAVHVLLEQELSNQDLKNNLVRMETVELPPGYSARKHIHPCPLFVYVIEGELLSEFEGVSKIYKPGDVFYEKATGVHSVTKNNLTTKPTKFLVFYLMKAGMETFLLREH